jgi:hypothetical protein
VEDAALRSVRFTGVHIGGMGAEYLLDDAGEQSTGCFDAPAGLELSLYE